jgi:hypothetical protein
MNRGAALALFCTAQFVLQLDLRVVNVALPVMLKSLEILPRSCSGSSPATH